MEWSEDAIAFGTRRHGESSVILEVLTRGHGRHLGLVRGGRSRRLRPTLQAGNFVHVTWRARLSEHLGNFSVEPVRDHAAMLMDSAAATFCVQLVGAHARLLPERDPHHRLYDAAAVIVEALAGADAAAELMVRFELLLLEELGFGLDLGRCAVTGTAEDLAYVSPKSGRAVSREAGRPYDNRMLVLPPFLVDRRPGVPPDRTALSRAFELTGHFLDRHVYAARGLHRPVAREGYLRAVLGA